MKPSIIKDPAKFVLVTGKVNYADEFDLEFFAILTDTEWEKIDAAAKKLFKQDPYESGHDFYFGTNEAVTIENYDNWRNRLTVAPLPIAMKNRLVDLFGDSEFGTGVGYITYVLNMLKDEANQ